MPVLVSSWNEDAFRMRSFSIFPFFSCLWIITTTLLSLRSPYSLWSGEGQGATDSRELLLVLPISVWQAGKTNEDAVCESGGLLCWHVPVGPSSTDLICDPHSVIYNRNLPIKTSILNTLDHCFVFSVWDLAWWRALRRVMVLIFPQQKCLGVQLTLSENSAEIPLRTALSYWSDLNKGIWLSQVIFVMLEGNLWRTLIKCR